MEKEEKEQIIQDAITKTVTLQIKDVGAVRRGTNEVLAAIEAVEKISWRRRMKKSQVAARLIMLGTAHRKARDGSAFSK